MSSECTKISRFALLLIVGVICSVIGCQPQSSPKIVKNPEDLTVTIPETEIAANVNLRPATDAPGIEMPALISEPTAQAPPADEIPADVSRNLKVAVAAPPKESAVLSEVSGLVATTEDAVATPVTAAKEASDWEQWPTPQCVLVITGQLFGYIEPCGCTGLENQKGGLMRRHSLIKQLSEKAWPLIPIDAGNQERRVGPQAAIKFQTTIDGLTEMGYQAVGFGPNDLRFGVENLLAATNSLSELRFISANVTLYDESMMNRTRVVSVGGRKIGIAAALDPGRAGKNLSSDITISDPVIGLTKSVQVFAEAGCDYRVLMWYGDTASANQLLKVVPQWDLVVLGDDPGEPEFQPAKADTGESRFIRVGHKGIHACLVGLFDDQKQPWRYARIPLTHQFSDSPEMLKRMAAYQTSLRETGLDNLGLRPVPHPSGRRFVGSEKCGECHTTAFGIWEKTPHAKATEDLVHPPNTRSMIPRHFDPECLSCHATGWNPQSYYPYESGYLSLEKTPQMVGNGCENCHGPGALHVAAEEGVTPADDARLAVLRDSMRLPLAKARDRCLECHDTDNSPDFGHDGAFAKYWAQVEHIGKD